VLVDRPRRPGREPGVAEEGTNFVSPTGRAGYGRVVGGVGGGRSWWGTKQRVTFVPFFPLFPFCSPFLSVFKHTQGAQINLGSIEYPGLPRGSS